MRYFLTILLLACSLQTFPQLLISETHIQSRSINNLVNLYNSNGIPQSVSPIEFPVDIYKLTYKTIDENGDSTTATGAVSLPVGKDCPAAIISYQHGTSTKKTSVPSHLSTEVLIGTIASANGYVGVMPDYLGLGDGPGFHLYHHAKTEATATIDMLRATREFCANNGISLSGEIFLGGYSQGGHATMAAHQEIQTYHDDEFNVVASCPMAGAYDMSGVMRARLESNVPYSQPAYLPYLFLGYNQVYDMYDSVQQYMVSPYDATIPPLFDGTNNIGVINNAMPSVPKNIVPVSEFNAFVSDSLHPMRVALRENDTYNWVPNVPMLLLYCSGDEVVPHQNSIVAYNAFVAQGATDVDTFNISPALGHGPCAEIAIIMSKSWFDGMRGDCLSVDFAQTNATTQTSTDATIDLTPACGSGPYTYLWNTGATTEDLTNIGHGDYQVAVMDDNGCTTNLEFNIPQPCDQVANVEVNPLGSSSVGISWQSDSAATAFQIQYRAQGQNAANTVIGVAGTSSRVIDNLLPGMNYQMRIRKSCGPVGLSEWKFKPFTMPASRLADDSSFRKATYHSGSQTVFVEYGSHTPVFGTVDVFDALGRKIFSGNQVFQSGMNAISLASIDLAVGAYFLTISQAGKRFHYSFLRGGN